MGVLGDFACLYTIALINTAVIDEKNFFDVKGIPVYLSWLEVRETAIEQREVSMRQCSHCIIS